MQARFAKLAKDCKLLDKKFTATDVDLTYAKVRISIVGSTMPQPHASSLSPLHHQCTAGCSYSCAEFLQPLQVKAKGARKIGFNEFKAALEIMAEKKGVLCAISDSVLWTFFAVSVQFDHRLQAKALLFMGHTPCRLHHGRHCVQAHRDQWACHQCDAGSAQQVP
jgi:hypothetical protein